jgi:hypothetical protein
MTDDHPFGHVAVVFAEIARTLLSRERSTVREPQVAKVIRRHSDATT